MTRVRYMPQALAALDDIFTYTRDTWGNQQADTYVSGLLATCRELREGPRRHIPPALGVDGFVAGYGKHRIYWRLSEDDDIIVVHILHERMHHQSRLDGL